MVKLWADVHEEVGVLVREAMKSEELLEHF